MEMSLKIALSRLLAFLGVLGLAAAFRPPQFLPLEPSKFFDNVRQDFFLPSPSSRQSSSSQVHGNIRYSNSPLEIDAGFHFKPLRLPPPPIFSPSFIPDMFRNFRRLEQNLFTPSRGTERPATPGQVRNYEMDLEEQRKEKEEELNDITTNNNFYEVEEYTTTTRPGSSYVNVGLTAGDNEYKYNYSV